MKYYKKIEGERIYLSPLCLEDAEYYVAWMNDPEITVNTHGATRVMNIEAEREWILNTLKNQEYTFAIVAKENDTLIGNCSLMHVNAIDQTATVGIFIGMKEYRSHGYGTEALNIILSYGFNVLHLHSIDLTVYDFNARAIRCYEKIGFLECGRRHECYYYHGKRHDRITMEIFEKDWREKNESSETNGRIG